jgi:hypothetical protein
MLVPCAWSELWYFLEPPPIGFQIWGSIRTNWYWFWPMLHQSRSNSLCNILSWSAEACIGLFWVGNIVPLWLVQPWNSSQILHDHWPPPYLNFWHNLWDKRWKKCALHLCHMHSSIMYKVIWGYTCSPAYTMLANIMVAE